MSWLESFVIGWELSPAHDWLATRIANTDPYSILETMVRSSLPICHSSNAVNRPGGFRKRRFLKLHRADVEVPVS